VSTVQYYLIDATSFTRLIYVGQAKDTLAKICNKTAMVECCLSSKM